MAKDQCVTECDKNKNELISTLGNTCVEKCGDKEFTNKDGDKCVKGVLPLGFLVTAWPLRENPMLWGFPAGTTFLSRVF